MKQCIVLGIESSCDETSVSIVKNGREVLSNVIDSQIAIHEKFGGVVPEIASRNHIQAISRVSKRALQEANMKFQDIDVIACTYGPGLVGALLVGVSSCTQENLKNIDTLAPVTMTVNLPSSIDGNVSRSLPSAPEGHSLRCIMVVDYSSAGDQRIEKVATGSEVNGVFRFSFTPVEESYNCLFWADYVSEDGTDKYYNTENIENITYKLSDNSIFNNPACDAFYGKALNGTTSVTLKRPFVKLSFVDKNQQTVSESSSLSVVYSVPSGFNVKDNTTASTQKIKLENAAPADKANSTWFYNYVFAASDDNKLGDISMTVDDRTNIVKGENIPLEANYEITASIDFASANGNVNVDVDIDDEYVDPDAPKIGQFLQKDGSFSDSYDENNSVAIVFAVGPKGKDTTGNYDQKFDGKKIWGYAELGLKEKQSAKAIAEYLEKEGFKLNQIFRSFIPEKI